MSTILINFYLHAKRINKILIALITGVFLTIEISFLIANLQKIKDGGWITLLIGSGLFSIMYIWWRGKKIKTRLTPLVAVEKMLPVIKKLSMDESIPKFATNLVYLTASSTERKIEKSSINSILNTGMPKRADIYWFIHLNVTDEPYTLEYSIDTVLKNDMYLITFNLGFRIEPKIDYYFRQAVNEMIASGEVNLSDRFELSYQQSAMGDFRFVLTESFLSYDNQLPAFKNFIMKSYYNLRIFSVKEAVNFGLEKSNFIIEKYPLVLTAPDQRKLKRIF